MIDTHAHLNFEEFDNDREEVIRRFFDGGGEKIINVGCDLKSSRESYELALKYKNIFAAVGVHPHDADTVDEYNLKKIKELTGHRKVIAVGEIGLDYFRNLSPREKQIEAFKLQLELAEDCQMPVIIHCRDACGDLLNVLKERKTSNWRGVIHCFNADWETAEKFLELGFYLGFTGIITYGKAKLAEESEIYKAVKNTPLNKILIETDCPYLTPVPKRGQRNEPLFVKYTAEKIAEIKKIGFNEIEKQTSRNAVKLFGI